MAVKTRKSKIAEESRSSVRCCGRCDHWHRLSIGTKGSCDKKYTSPTYVQDNPKCYLTFDNHFCSKFQPKTN